MSDAHRRPKTPDLTRQALLEAGAAVALRDGLSTLSLPAVAEAAEVTKGAVFHHFSSRQGLIEAIATEIIARIDTECALALVRDEGQDGGGYGRFTRAYLHCIFHPAHPASPWAAPTCAYLADPALAGLWRDWIGARLAAHAATDGTTALTSARLAADGYWLAKAFGPMPGESAATLYAHLLALTRETAP
ncbi:MAG: TetR/AcrR family transcriptional regulator [Gemmobacter sp.]|jgi:AcrR family transcriptional regulator|nr:TetR/AcrR family transcriptional regulator [Gemmobacter sp.]